MDKSKLLPLLILPLLAACNKPGPHVEYYSCATNSAPAVAWVHQSEFYYNQTAGEYCVYSSGPTNARLLFTFSYPVLNNVTNTNEFIAAMRSNIVITTVWNPSISISNGRDGHALYIIDFE